MQFPIKYIEGNMIKNIYDEWWAYYSLEPFNYAFLSRNEKLQYFYKFSQLIGQTRKGNVHLLQLSVEENMRNAMKRSKEYIAGNLIGIADNVIDRATNVLVDGKLFAKPESDEDTPFWVGETQLEYRFYIGFRLMPFDDNMSNGMLGYLKDTLVFWKDYISGINHNLMGGCFTVSNDEIERYKRIENLNFGRINSLFTVHRIAPVEMAYIIEHLHGMHGKSVEEYKYNYVIEKDNKKSKVDSYDILKLSNIEIEESQKTLIYTSDVQETFCSLLSYSELVSDIEYPGSEILFYQQSRFNFPVDTSIRLEIVDNKKALSELRNRQKNLKDMDNHAFESGNDTATSIIEAIEDADELENYLQDSKDVMFIMSYLVRVTAPDKQELIRRVNSVRDFYDDYNIKLVCPSGDMIKFHNEFLPASKTWNVIKKKLSGYFFSGLGFGASQDICEKEGIPLGYVLSSLRFFFLKPWLAAQGIKGSKTNSLSCAFIGSLGWGKSFSNKILIYYAILFGAKAVMIDPKSECGNFKETLPNIADEINIINLTNNKQNKGILDPFVIMTNIEDAENLALDILTYLLGISIRDSVRYPVLRNSIKAVASSNVKGMINIITELRKVNSDVSNALANHIEGFSDIGLGQLLFSDGNNNSSVSFSSQLNIIQIADLMLPGKDKNVDEYTPTEMISVALMIVVSTFCLDFIHSEPDIFKITNIDEAWSLLNISQGKTLVNKLIREGRSMNAGVYIITQNAQDLLDETIRNNIGMFFVFHSEDKVEIENSLKLLGLDPDDTGNQKMISTLGHGECVIKDIYGRINVVKIEYLLPELKEAFRTTPKNENSGGDVNGNFKR